MWSYLGGVGGGGGSQCIVDIMNRFDWLPLPWVPQSSDDEDNMRGGAWCANSEDKEHWLEIDARQDTEFTGIITQGRDSQESQNE